MRKGLFAQKEKIFLNDANCPTRQTNSNFWVVVRRGGGGGGTLGFWAGVSNVTQEPLAFTTPCSAAILLP